MTDFDSAGHDVPSKYMYLLISMVCMYVSVIGETVDARAYGDVSSVPILLDDVKCTGSESNLLSLSTVTC